MGVSYDDMDDDFKAMIERSSLGTPAAKAARDSVSDEKAAEILARSYELDDETLDEFLTSWFWGAIPGLAVRDRPR